MYPMTQNQYSAPGSPHKMYVSSLGYTNGELLQQQIYNQQVVQYQQSREYQQYRQNREMLMQGNYHVPVVPVQQTEGHKHTRYEVTWSSEQDH